MDATHKFVDKHLHGRVIVDLRPVQVNEEEYVGPHVVLMANVVVKSFTVMFEVVAVSTADETCVSHVGFRGPLKT